MRLALVLLGCACVAATALKPQGVDDDAGEIPQEHVMPSSAGDVTTPMNKAKKAATPAADPAALVAQDPIYTSFKNLERKAKDDEDKEQAAFQGHLSQIATDFSSYQHTLHKLREEDAKVIAHLQQQVTGLQAENQKLRGQLTDYKSENDQLEESRKRVQQALELINQSPHHAGK